MIHCLFHFKFLVLLFVLCLVVLAMHARGFYAIPCCVSRNWTFWSVCDELLVDAPSLIILKRLLHTFLAVQSVHNYLWVLFLLTTLIQCLQNTKDNRSIHTYESNFLHNLHHGWWVGWSCWGDFKIETLDNLSPENVFHGEDRKGHGRGDGSRNSWFQHRGTTNTTLFLTWPRLCCGVAHLTSFHYSILCPRICCVSSSGKNLNHIQSCHSNYSYACVMFLQYALQALHYWIAGILTENRLLHEIVDYKCLQSGVWECCSILAWCPWTHHSSSNCLTAAANGIVKHKRSGSVNTVAHYTPSIDNMVPFVLQRPLWTCFC